MLKKYIYLPRNLWGILFLNSLCLYLLIFLVFGILAACGIGSFRFKDMPPIASLGLWLLVTPWIAVMFASWSWLLLKGGNILLRLIAIAKGDL